jgi:hypothetical protein
MHTKWPITVVPRSKAWTVSARSNTGIMGSNPTGGMDGCLRLFCGPAQVAALRRDDPPPKESHRLSIWLRNCKTEAKVCSHLLTLVPRSRIFLHWRWRRYVPPKRRFTQDLHGDTYQKRHAPTATVNCDVSLEGGGNVDYQSPRWAPSPWQCLYRIM